MYYHSIGLHKKYECETMNYTGKNCQKTTQKLPNIVASS